MEHYLRSASSIVQFISALHVQIWSASQPGGRIEVLHSSERHFLSIRAGVGQIDQWLMVYV